MSARSVRLLLLAACIAMLAVPSHQASAQRRPVRTHHSTPDSVASSAADAPIIEVEAQPVDTLIALSIGGQNVADIVEGSPYDIWEESEREYNPDPTRAVWMSALFPGLGQIYNRRYWKLPIVVGGYLGLTYATTWNNGLLTDYTKAYRDIMDSDPSTNSYMDFFPPTIQESDLDQTWLRNILQARKNYFRRNRDLCIIAMVGVYLIAMVDAYVDASLSHFDISPDLSLDLNPMLMPGLHSSKPAIGLQWALNF